MTTLTKYSLESRVYNFDFAAVDELAVDGDTIATVTSVTSVPTSGLTIGTPSVSSPIVSVTISGGTPGVDYELRCLVHTAANAVLLGIGRLVVPE